jgi:dTDP-4-amino-4,6-dideoxygalactose transaminase
VEDRKIPFNRPSLISNEIDYIRDAVERGQLSGDGFYTRSCNALVENLTGSGKALLTHSCTAALEMAALLCRLEPGDEVVMPSFTFVSTANAVALRGAIPVFVDIDPLTLNVDPEAVAKAVTERTKAIFVVHYAGFPADMDALLAIANEHDLFVVEDAAQALGSTYKGRPAGSLGDMAAISFHETKNVISGEGGVLTLNRPELYDRAEIIREKGTNRALFFRGHVDKYTWTDIGSSYLPGELIAAYLFAQLEKSDEILRRRLSIFDRYMEAFAELSSSGRVRIPVTPPECTGNGHMFYLLLANLDERSRFIAHMREKGITTPFHYVPLHSAPAGLKYGRASNILVNTDRISDTLVRLPMFYDLGDNVETVITIALDFFRDRTSMAA